MTKLTAVGSVFVFGSCLSGDLSFAQKPEATGSSTITVGATEVIAVGMTQLDYSSAAYYKTGVSVALFVGPSEGDFTLVGQDDEVAARSSVSGTVETTIANNQVYYVDSAHYLELIYSSGGRGGSSGYIDESGFSLLPQDDPTESSEVDPDDIERFAPLGGGAAAFTVGAGTQQFNITYPSVQNSFYDFHYTTNVANLLAVYQPQNTSCNVISHQTYSCRGKAIGQFTITRTLQATTATINGTKQNATQVFVTKQTAQ